MQLTNTKRTASNVARIQNNELAPLLWKIKRPSANIDVVVMEAETADVFLQVVPGVLVELRYLRGYVREIECVFHPLFVRSAENKTYRKMSFEKQTAGTN